ncbi:hypothetical protein ABT373_37200 [Streptomyces sp. NPDC000070]|uniref:hypothetical protein n=1 Tax=Streptomyces sp. NPDC000070 TaxID=3154240 RepID=UPI003322AC2B
MTDEGEIGTAFPYRSTSTLARVAQVLGRAEDAARYSSSPPCAAPTAARPLPGHRAPTSMYSWTATASTAV